jgi:hypothetical protein
MSTHVYPGVALVDLLAGLGMLAFGGALACTTVSER